MIFQNDIESCFSFVIPAKPVPAQAGGGDISPFLVTPAKAGSMAPLLDSGSLAFRAGPDGPAESRVRNDE